MLRGGLVYSSARAAIYRHQRLASEYAHFCSSDLTCSTVGKIVMMQRAVEGDCEPIMWQGIEVGQIRKFDSRLQVEMAPALMPDRFKTPGQAELTINEGDKILVLTEERRAKLMAARRRALEALPASEVTVVPHVAQVISD